MRALLLSLITYIFLLPVHAQKKIRLHAADHKLDSVKRYQKILIIGEGGLQVHMYMDYLSAELIRELKHQQIECKYEFLGDQHKTDTKVALRKALAWPHDAVLRFSPLSADEIQRRSSFVSPGLTIPGSTAIVHPNVSRSQNLVTNDFDITLMEGAETVWSARLSTSIEPGKNTVYRRIRKLILEDLEKQNVLVLPY